MEELQTHRKILMIAKEEFFQDLMAEYAINLAERLKYELIAVNVNTTGFYNDLFNRNSLALLSNTQFQKKAALQGVKFQYQARCGTLWEAVEDIVSRIKGIELILTDSKEHEIEIAECSSVPVFSFITQHKKRGENIMAELEQNKKPIGKMIGYGVGTAALYAAVFMNADTVTSYFTKGALYAALPVLTVFVFSFVHGAFASNLWSVLGIEAQKKAGVQAEKKKSVQVSKRAAKRPRVYAPSPEARVNPFHRI
ncbi:MAG: hypothetical protein AB7U45_12035 [Desulfamplus sp.]